MSLRKRCSKTEPAVWANGTSNPLHCPASPRCDHHWHYDFRVNGRRYRNTTETDDKHKARDIEARERSRILDGRHGIRRQPDTTFRLFAAEYINTHAVPNKRASTLQRDREMLARVLLPTFGGQLLTEITAFGIEQLKAKRLAKGCRPGTVNRELMLLKGILTKAVEWKRLVVSPAAAVRPIKGTGARTRILTTDEQAALLEAYQKGRRRHVRPIIELLLITGARLGELLALRWEDTTDGYLRFVETKNGKPRRLPLTARMAEILARMPHKDPTFVFVSGRSGTRYKRLITGFKAALKDAGIDGADVVIHTLRHTALSRMMDGGADVRTIMEISGHSSLAMLERYTHPTEQRKTEALNTYGLVTNRAQSTADQTKTGQK
ncbi:MAG: site-specific integrase [Acidobacteriota bacterium]